MHRKRLTAMVAIAVCGALLTGGGVAAATDAPAARAGTGVPAAREATRAPATGGHVFLTAYQNDDLPGATVVLTGAIGDLGAAVSVLRNGTVDPEHSSQLNLALTQGTFRIAIGPLHLTRKLGPIGRAAANLDLNGGKVAGETSVVRREDRDAAGGGSGLGGIGARG